MELPYSFCKCPCPNRPFQKRAWSCVTSYYSPLWGSHYHTLDRVNPYNGYDVMHAFEKVDKGPPSNFQHAKLKNAKRCSLFVKLKMKKTWHLGALLVTLLVNLHPSQLSWIHNNPSVFSLCFIALSHVRFYFLTSKTKLRMLESNKNRLASSVWIQLYTGEFRTLKHAYRHRDDKT